MFCHITHALSFSFPFPPSQVPWSSSAITNMFYIWVCMCSCFFSCICLSFGSIFQVWEKRHDLPLSELDLLHWTQFIPLPTHRRYFCALLGIKNSTLSLCFSQLESMLTLNEGGGSWTDTAWERFAWRYSTLKTKGTYKKSWFTPACLCASRSRACGVFTMAWDPFVLVFFAHCTGGSL
jgi:hypothetical protein